MNREIPYAEMRRLLGLPDLGGLPDLEAGRETVREIPYTEMRRLLGLPDVESPGTTRWAVRKIRSGDHRGDWGVWRYTSTTAATLVEAFAQWPDAIDHVDRADDT